MKTALLLIPSTSDDVRRYDYLQVCLKKVMEENSMPLTPNIYEKIYPVDQVEFINKVLYMVDYVYLFVDFGIDQIMFDVIDRAVAAQIEIRYKRILDIDRILSDPHLVLLDVCRKLNVKPEDLKGRDRHRNYAEARQVYCRRARELTRASLQQIGNHINKDHATVLHSIRMANTVKEVADLYDKYYGTPRIKTETVEGETKAADNRHSYPVERPVLPFRSMDPREQNIPTRESPMHSVPAKGFYSCFGGY